MTAIADLQGGATNTWIINRKGDIRDAMIFTLPNAGPPVPLDGIAFSGNIVQAGSTRVFLTVSTGNGFLQILPASASVAVQGNGIGYVVGERVSLAGGSYVVPATLQITGIGPQGGAASAVMLSPGLYSALPSSPAPQLASLSGVGAGATFNLTWVNNALAVLVPQASIPASLLPGAYTMDLIATADGLTVDVVTFAITVI